MTVRQPVSMKGQLKRVLRWEEKGAFYDLILYSVLIEKGTEFEGFLSACLANGSCRPADILGSTGCELYLFSPAIPSNFHLGTTLSSTLVSYQIPEPFLKIFLALNILWIYPPNLEG